MTTLPAPAPFPYFTDASGTALDGGKIYIGTAGLDPRTNPIAVYQDAANTIAWAQPLRTVSGYPAYQGAASNFYPAAGVYSIIVEDSRGAVLLRDLNGTNLVDASSVSVNDGVSGANFTTVQGFIDDIQSDGGASLIGVDDSASGVNFTTVQGFADYQMAQNPLIVEEAVTEATAASAASASAAASSASAAAIAAAFQRVLPTTPSALPYEVKTITLGTAGTGAAVSGEFALTVAGGPIGHTAFVTIAGGTQTGVRIGNRGISTSATAPTYTLPTITGLTGATAPTATTGTIGVNDVFSAPTADGLSVGAWGNNAGALATAPFGVAQQTKVSTKTFTAASADSGFIGMLETDGASRILKAWDKTGAALMKVAAGSQIARGALQGGALPDGYSYVQSSPDSGFIGERLVDANGTILWGITKAGYLLTRLDPRSTGAGTFDPATLKGVLYPTDTISGWGDSYMSSALTDAVAYELGQTAINFGRGGQTSTEIAARQGAMPCGITLVGNSIPASTSPVVVTAIDFDVCSNAGVFSGLNVTIAGVVGVLSAVASSGSPTIIAGVSGGSRGQTAGYSFTPTVAPPSPVAVSAGTALVFTDAVAHVADEVIVSMGRNNIGQVQKIVDDQTALISNLSTTFKRAWFISVCNGTNDGNGQSNGTYATFIAIEKAMERRLGYRFINLRRWLIDNYQAITGNLATYTASITGNVMTVTAPAKSSVVAGSGLFQVGQTLWIGGSSTGRTITALGTGTGGIGTYTVSSGSNVSSTTIIGALASGAQDVTDAAADTVPAILRTQAGSTDAVHVSVAVFALMGAEAARIIKSRR